MATLKAGSVCGRAGVKGFTLLELLIVGALIALFAGIGMFGVTEMYNSNRHKLMFDETKNIGTALNIAHNDLGFFPRISVLGQHLKNLQFQNGSQTILLPAMDTYGFNFAPLSTEISPFAANIISNWKGPYMPGFGQRSGQGQAGYTKMRLTDAGYQSFNPGAGSSQQDYSLVNWPTDVWGNPYMLYRLSTDKSMISTNNPKGLYLVTDPSEEGTYFTGIISFGKNGYPGGKIDRNYDDASKEAALKLVGLYVKGDVKGGENKAFFSLKSVTSTYGAETSLDSTVIKQVSDNIALIFEGTANPDQPGILDPGSDDIIARF